MLLDRYYILFKQEKVPFDILQKWRKLFTISQHVLCYLHGMYSSSISWFIIFVKVWTLVCNSVVVAIYRKNTH